MKSISKLFNLFILIIGFSNLQAQNVNTNMLSNLVYPDQNLNDIWGYSDQGMEYALVGCQFGTSIVNVTNPVSPVEVAYIDGNSSTWRDLKTYGEYAYVVDDEAGEGLIIINLSELPTSIEHSSWFGDGQVNFSTVHNIFIDENGVAYLFGANYLNGGAIMLDVKTDPENPVVIGIYNERYVHDGFVRNDTLWAAEINDGLLSVVDIADKQNPIILGAVSTPSNFAHNCWLSDDGKTIFTTDEVDGAYLTAYDVSDVSDIKEIDRIQSNPGSFSPPHNSFVKDNFLVTAYYTDGLVVHDITQPANMIEVANFDSSPLSGSGVGAGAWGVYPYLPSGNVLVTDVQEGLFVVNVNYIQACYLNGSVTDIDTGDPLPGATISIVGTSNAGTTEFGGTYQTGTTEAGFYTIEVSKPGFFTVTMEDVLLANGLDTNLDFELDQMPSFALTGRVVDGDYVGVDGASVVVENNGFYFDILTDEEGYFNIPTFFEGEYNVIAGLWGFNSAAISNTFIEEGSYPYLQLNEGYYDDFTFDFGWSTSGTTGLGGEWLIDDPVGTSFGEDGPLNPEDDIADDFGNTCYFTGNDGLFDFVGGGSVTLTSPVFDLSEYGDPILSYYRWFANFGAYGPAFGDNLLIELSNGEQSVILENLGSSDNLLEWVYSEFKVSDFLSPTANMQITLAASADFSYYELLECGFDGFKVTDATGIVGFQDVAKEELLEVEVFPNPFSSKATLRINNYNENDVLTVSLFDPSGKEIRKQSVNRDVTEINSIGLTNGLYFYSVHNDSKILSSGSVVIQR